MVDKVTDLILFISKLFVVGAVGKKIIYFGSLFLLTITT